ncbi:hypothetical protein MMPV_001419 [Pyropia vietnamensis]
MIISELDLALARTPAPLFGLRRRPKEDSPHPPPHPTTASPVAAAATPIAEEPLAVEGAGGDGGVDEPSPPLGGDKAAAAAVAVPTATTAAVVDGNSGGDGDGGGDGGSGGSNRDGRASPDSDTMGVSHTTPKPTTPRRPALPLVVGPGDLAVREDHPFSRHGLSGERNELSRGREHRYRRNRAAEFDEPKIKRDRATDGRRGGGVDSPPPSRQAVNASGLGDVGSAFYDGRRHRRRRSTHSISSSEHRRRRRSDSAARHEDVTWAAPSAEVTSVPVSERWVASPPPSRSPSPTASMRSRTLSPSGAGTAGTALGPLHPHRAVVSPPPSPPPRRRSPSREQWLEIQAPVVSVTPAKPSQPAVAAAPNAATARGDDARQPVFLPRPTSLCGRSLSDTASSQSDVSSASGLPSVLSGGVTVYEDRSREAVAAAAELAAGDPTTAHPLAATSRVAHVRESERSATDYRRAASAASYTSSNPDREREEQERQPIRRRRHYRNLSSDADRDDGEDDNSIAVVSSAARDGEGAPRRSGPYTAADVLGITDAREPPSRTPSVASSLVGRLPSDIETNRKGDSQTCPVKVTIAPTNLSTLTQRDIVAVLETRVLPARHEVTTAARRDKIRWVPVEEVALPQVDLTAGPVRRTFEESLKLHPNADLRRQSREVRVLYYELVPTVHSEPERIQLAFSSVRLEHVSEADAGRLVVPVELFPRPTGVPASVKAALGRRPGGRRRHQAPPTTAFTLQYVRSGEQPVLIDISLTVHRLVGWPFSAARPFFVLYVPRPGSINSWKPIWRSEVMVASRIVARSPSFLAGWSPSVFHYSPVELPSLSTISAASSADGGDSGRSDDLGGGYGNRDASATGGNGGDGYQDQRLLIEFFHYKTSSNPRLLGILRTSLKELHAMPPEGGSLPLNTPQFKQLVGGARLRSISPVPAGVRYALHFEFGGLTAGTCHFLRVLVAFGPLLADLAAPRAGGRRKVSAFFALYRRRSSRRGEVVQLDEGVVGGDGGGGGTAADEGSSTSDTERDSWKQLFQSEVAVVDCPKPQRAQGNGSADVRRFSHLVGSLWRDRSDTSPTASRGSTGGVETPSSSRTTGAAASNGDVVSAPHVIPFRYYRVPPLGHCRSPENCELLLSVFLYHPTGNHKQVASVRTSFAELLGAPTDTPLPRFYAVPAVAAGASASVIRSERQEQRSFVNVRFAFPSA